jgi:Gpi18-like mannosyltransferase
MPSKVPPTTIIKIPSIAFDYIGAFYVYRLVKLKYGSWLPPYLAAFAFLMAPSVILNGAAWGQCDTIFTAFLLASIFYACQARKSVVVDH